MKYIKCDQCGEPIYDGEMAYKSGIDIFCSEECEEMHNKRVFTKLDASRHSWLDWKEDDENVEFESENQT